MTSEVTGGPGTRAPSVRGDAPPSVARRAARVAVRTVGVATAPLRPLPDFLIIGAKRSGTTSLFRYIDSHPCVLAQFPSARHMPFMAMNTKGVHWFDRSPERGRWWYRSHFPTAATRTLASRRAGAPVATGEGSPYYFIHPEAPVRAAAELPHARLIVVVRNPVDRAYSHWAEQRRDAREPLDFVEALDAEAARLEGEEERLGRREIRSSVHYEHHSYVRQGEYARFLERWYRGFPKEQLLVLLSEDLYRDPQSTLDRVFRFLGLAPHRLTDPQPWNAAPRSPMAEGTRRRLEEHFRPWNEQFVELTGVQPSWGA